MDKLLFGIIAVSATTGFVLGIIEGFWVALIISLIIVVLLLILVRRLPG
jgi:hypothetical protein